MNDGVYVYTHDAMHRATTTYVQPRRTIYMYIYIQQSTRKACGCGEIGGGGEEDRSRFEWG